jgi:hypothetical protein
VGGQEGPGGRVSSLIDTLVARQIVSPVMVVAMMMCVPAM